MAKRIRVRDEPANGRVVALASASCGPAAVLAAALAKDLRPQTIDDLTFWPTGAEIVE